MGMDKRSAVTWMRQTITSKEQERENGSVHIGSVRIELSSVDNTEKFFSPRAGGTPEIGGGWARGTMGFDAPGPSRKPAGVRHLHQMPES